MPWANKKTRENQSKASSDSDDYFYSTSQQERIDDLFQTGHEAFGGKKSGESFRFSRIKRRIQRGALVVSAILFVGYLIATNQEENAVVHSPEKKKFVVDSAPTSAVPAARRGYCVDSSGVDFITEAACGNRPWFTTQSRAHEEYHRLKSPAVVTANDSAVAQQQLSAIPLPPNGTSRFFVKEERPALLKVKASGKYHYLVKMTRPNSTDTVVDLIVRAGQQAQIKVPLGTFHIKWATGQTWYGYEKGKRFGPSTDFNKADQLFTFEQEVTETSTGYMTSTTVLEITLFEVISGNMKSKDIPESQF